MHAFYAIRVRISQVQLFSLSPGSLRDAQLDQALVVQTEAAIQTFLDIPVRHKLSLLILQHARVGQYEFHVTTRRYVATSLHLVPEPGHRHGNGAVHVDA